LDYEFGSGWAASAVWTYNSGLPFTQVVGYYDKFYLEDISANISNYDPRLPFAIYGIQNLSRLPDYHRLDLTISKKIKTDFMNIQLDVSGINVYNRKNIFYFKRDTGERVNMLPFIPTVTVKVEL
jgi:hypothetical protein